MYGKIVEIARNPHIRRGEKGTRPPTKIYDRLSQSYQWLSVINKLIVDRRHRHREPSAYAARILIYANVLVIFHRLFDIAFFVGLQKFSGYCECECCTAGGNI